ncbi:MAG: FAD-dependent oxidoreductase [Nitrospiria bacterium]
MMDRFDVIIVGAGPAGSAAALVCARAGLQTVVLERGEFPGAKNIFGGVLYTPVLNELIPGFWKEAPIERPVVSRRFSILSASAESSFSFRESRFNQPPFNHSFTALRSRFDRWFSKKAEEAGAMIIPQTLVEELWVENGQIVGVRAGREGGDLRADLVICAEGANSFLAQKIGLREKYPPKSMAVAVKEVMTLPKEVINDRFQLEEGEGAAYEFFAGSVNGLIGSAFIYTNQESLSVGLGCTIESLIDQKMNTNDLLDRFKNHPSIRPLIKGAEPQEFAAHLIPEGGYHQVPKMVMNGLMLAGDAAHLVNSSLYHEGTNLAMASGMLAGRTAVEAREKGDFSESFLNRYLDRLNQSFVMKDLKRYAGIAQWAHSNPQFFKEYPETALDLLKDYFTISTESKGDIQKKMWRKLKRKTSLFKLARNLYRFKKVMFPSGG